METKMLMEIIDFGDEAERLMLRHFLSDYLPFANPSVWSLDDTCITARRIGNRYGVPADATTWQYRLENPDCAWTVDIRAVWRCDRLLRPWSTHIAVTAQWDDEDRYGSPDVTREAFREWLRAMPL